MRSSGLACLVFRYNLWGLSQGELRGQLRRLQRWIEGATPSFSIGRPTDHPSDIIVSWSVLPAVRELDPQKSTPSRLRLGVLFLVQSRSLSMWTGERSW